MPHALQTSPSQSDSASPAHPAPELSGIPCSRPTAPTAAMLPCRSDLQRPGMPDLSLDHMEPQELLCSENSSLGIRLKTQRLLLLLECVYLQMTHPRR